jgi:ERCC4-type nuclease
MSVYQQNYNRLIFNSLKENRYCIREQLSDRIMLFPKATKVIVDNRERNTDLIETMVASGMDIEFKTVPVGDYIISDRVCIERKTVSDFEGSIINGRLFDQIKRLKENYEFPIILLEGEFDYFRLKRNVINGAIASIYIDYGIVVINTQDAHNTAEMIFSIARHEQIDHDRLPSMKGGARAYTNNQFQEYIIGNIPGIGQKLARSLLLHFKSIKSIVNATPEELTKVEKIGKKKALLIHNTLNGIYSEE